MNHAKRFCAALLLGLSLPFAPLAAQAPPSATATSDPFVTLVTSIEASVDQQAMLDRALGELRASMLAQNADVAEMERLFPGTLDKMMTAMRPYVQRHMERTTVSLRGDTAALLRTSLTSAEAREATRFYSSPLGRRLMGSVGENFSMKATLGEALKDEGEGNISAGAIQRDVYASVIPALAGMKPDDLAAMQELAAKSTWLPKLGALQPRLSALQAQAANRPMLPEDEQAMGRAIAAVVDEILGTQPKR